MLTPDKQSAHVLVPHGLVAARRWLSSQGVSRHTLDNWIKSGKLMSLAPGVYTSSETLLTWQGIVCSLQRMGYDLHPGGVTALNLAGLGQYTELGGQKTVLLYGEDKPPAWAERVLGGVKFTWHRDLSLDGDEPFTAQQPLGPDQRPLVVATPERAWFEVLMGIPKVVSFEHADQLMAGLVNLSPRRLNALLVSCKSVKVRRLFLWYAERHHHAWLDRLNREHFTFKNGELGSGKRMVAKGGKLDSRYLITVPADMTGGGHEQK